MMLPVDVLKEIGIEQPKEGMKLSFTVTFGFFEQKTGTLCLKRMVSELCERQKRAGSLYFGGEGGISWMRS